jgi:hypothetical protein
LPHNIVRLLLGLAGGLSIVLASWPSPAQSYYNPYRPFGVNQSDAISLPASGMELIGPYDNGTTDELVEGNGLLEQLNKEIAQQKEQELTRHMTWKQYQEYKRRKKTSK